MYEARVNVKPRSAAYWLVTLDNPPINLIDPKRIAGLQTFVEGFERGQEVNVVFDNADPDLFRSHSSPRW